ncbi:luc7-like protein 3 [Brevipalpus obovatus]|uniref:luc7-like protein 3 n=1 Tax=Brevipalpus obovatus TaxID=246614 RepID=UPI003D9F8C95
MALQSARQLLDELMGRERNLRPTEKTSDAKEDWNDPRICRYFLVCFCPNQLFTNTKADMGPCHKIHDDYIKQCYEEHASRKQKSAFEDEFIRFCQQTLGDVERRIKRAKQRLAASQTEKAENLTIGGNGSSLSEEVKEKMRAISDQIEKLLLEIEDLGCQGKVEEAQTLMNEVEQLKEEKTTLKRGNLPTHWIQQRAEMGAAQEKQMEVCDVCGAFLIVNDVQQRVEDHLMGKQHVGYGKLKAALDDLLQRRKQDRGDQGRPRSPSRFHTRSEPSYNDRIKSRERSRSRERLDRSERNGLSRPKDYDSSRHKDNHRHHSPHRRQEKYSRRDHPERRSQTASSRYNDRRRSRSPSSNIERRRDSSS